QDIALAIVLCRHDMNLLLLESANRNRRSEPRWIIRLSYLFCLGREGFPLVANGILKACPKGPFPLATGFRLSPVLPFLAAAFHSKAMEARPTHRSYSPNSAAILALERA